MNAETNKIFKQQEMIFVLLNKPIEDLKKYFIKSELTNNELYTDLQFNINHAFIAAAHNCRFNIVKYLLTSPELEIHADIHFNDDAAMHSACCRGNQHLVEYLLNSPDLKEHAKIPNKPTDLQYIFEALCESITEIIEEINQYDYSSESMTGITKYAELDEYYEFLHYLIYDCEVRPTEDIISNLKEYTDKNFYEPAIKKLELNERFKSLDEELKNNIGEKKKLKI